MTSIHQDPGSFRDPLSRVYVGDGQVVRAFTELGAKDCVGQAVYSECFGLWSTD